MKQDSAFRRLAPSNFAPRVKRLAAAAAAFFVAIGLIVLAKSDFCADKKETLSYLFHEATLSLDLRVDQILVKGRVRTPQKKLLEALNAPVGTPILALDIHKAHKKIAALPWVKSVRIERRLPHTIFIDLTEREPIAVWQHKNGGEEIYTPVDSDGRTVNAKVKNLKDFLLVVGKNAPKKTPSLIQFLKQEPVLYARVRAATLMSNRRWDITLDSVSDGIIVKLPEKAPEAEWSRLLRLDKTHGLLKRTVTMIDLRFADKVIVRFDEPKKKKTAPSSLEIKKEAGI